jgi:exonuclease III
VLSVLAFNLQAAALPRAERVLAWLDGREDGMVILTETSNGPGTSYLLDRYRAAGYHVVHMPSVDGDRGCAMVSRLELAAGPELRSGVSLPGRAVAVTLATEPAVTVVGLYVPSSDRAPEKVAKKRAFLASVLHVLRDLTDEQRANLILGGDYNVIARDHQPRYPAFLPFEYEFLDALPELGLADTYRHLHPGEQVHSWIGRGGNGYRFDYFHAGSALTPHLIGCEYLHGPREQRLSDHAAVAVSLNLDVAHLHVATQALAEAPTLF